MTLDQSLAFAIVGGMMALFVWGRLRYDLVAMLALLVSVAAGIVPADKAFAGFSDDIVIIVASALLVSAAVSRSGIVEAMLRPLAPRLTTTGLQVLVLAGTVTILSAFVKNVGALALLMPVTFQLARKTGTSPSHLLMPLAFGSLLGGMMTLIGTSPNIIVSRMRTELLGEPFRMFDFTPVALALSVAGLAFLAFGYRLLPASRKGAASVDAAFNIEGYTTEIRVPPDSPFVGKTIADLQKLAEGDATVTRIMGESARRAPAADRVLAEDEHLILKGDPDALERIVARAKLELVGEASPAKEGTAPDDVGVVEAVVMGDSILVGRTPSELGLRRRWQVNLLAISRSGQRMTRELRATRFRPGDVIVLQGDITDMHETLGELGALPLAERAIPLGRGRRTLLPVLVLAVAMTLVALSLVPVAIAFFGAAVVLLLTRSLGLREAYSTVQWPILILLGALIPVSEAVRTTGGTELLAGWLSIAADGLPPFGALGLVLVAAMAVTPFLNNAATVLVMAPVAASLAQQLGLNPDPFLMAVAVGAACDFLTPIGHQSNTLVMGPGGYRFTDYWRLGLPLSVMVVLLGTGLIAVFWPLRP